MAFKVVIFDQAERDIVSAFDYLEAQGASEAARRWYRGILTEIRSLSEMPARGTIAYESEKLGFEIRQLLYGKRSGVYRILFRIIPESGEVHVIAVRHSARREFSPGID